MSIGYQHGQWFETMCLDCGYGDNAIICEHDCCFKCINCELTLVVKHDPDTYDIELSCCMTHAYPARSCKHYCESDE